MRTLSFFILFCIATVSAAGQSISDHTTLLASLAPHGVGPSAYSNLWGYAANGREYALLGCYGGMSIVDVTIPTQPKEVAFTAGAENPWREIKTYSHYAYVVNDANTNGFPDQGVQIIDLSQLPDTAILVNTYHPANDPGFVHTLFIDDKGFLYLAGTRSAKGLIIADLKNDPVHPVEVGRWTDRYWHDMIVRDDTIYGSTLRDGIQILDGHDKANLKEISRTAYPGAFTHNIWTTDGANYISSTNEYPDAPVQFWDDTDPKNLKLLATYTAGPTSTEHNSHHRGNYAFISSYYDGLKILDLTQRKMPVEVGHYDTYPDDNFKRGYHFEGAWGTYPFLPSGNILISDIKYGLFIVAFDGTHGGYIHGTVRNAITKEPISDVQVEVLGRPASEGATTPLVGIDGQYIIGSSPAVRNVQFSHYGYENYFLADVSFESGAMSVHDIDMIPLPQVSLFLSVRTTSGEPVPGAQIRISGPNNFASENQTDGNGNYTTQFFLGTYTIELITWGYRTSSKTVTFTSAGNEQVLFTLEPGYTESFTKQQGWGFGDTTDNTGWSMTKVSENPAGDYLPLVDYTGNPDGYVAMSRSRYGHATLVSPLFDGTRVENAFLQFRRFFNPYGWIYGPAHDTLHVAVSNNGGLTWTPIESYTSIDSAWKRIAYRLADYIPLTNTMKIRFRHVEGSDSLGSKWTYAMIDQFEILPSASVDVAEPVSSSVPSIAFPNPSTGQTIITWHQPDMEAAEITLYNVLGEQVKQIQTISTGAGQQSVVLDLSALANGLYFYQIHAGRNLLSAHSLTLYR